MMSPMALTTGKNIISFSGGKDSTALLLMMIDRGIRIDDILYVDTTKEFPDMEEHIKRIGGYIQPLKITRLSFDFDYYFSEIMRIKGKYKGIKGYGWPSPLKRWCTTFKLKSMRDYIKDKYGGKSIINNFVGIAYDEAHRMNKKKLKKGERVIRPLVHWGIKEADALEYCYEKGFDWNGLYNHFPRVSCYCCPLKSLTDLKALYLHYPELWENMVRMDADSIFRFRRDYSLKDLSEMFAVYKDQLSNGL